MNRGLNMCDDQDFDSLLQANRDQENRIEDLELELRVLRLELLKSENDRRNIDRAYYLSNKEIDRLWCIIRALREGNANV